MLVELLRDGPPKNSTFFIFNDEKRASYFHCMLLCEQKNVLSFHFEFVIYGTQDIYIYIYISIEIFKVTIKIIAQHWCFVPHLITILSYINSLIRFYHVEQYFIVLLVKLNVFLIVIEFDELQYKKWHNREQNLSNVQSFLSDKFNHKIWSNSNFQAIFIIENKHFSFVFV